MFIHLWLTQLLFFSMSYAPDLRDALLSLALTECAEARFSGLC